MNELKEHNVIEVTLKSQEEDEPSINMGALGRRLKNMKGVATKVLVVALVAGLLVGGVKSILGAEQRAQMMVGFGYDGIERGLDPNGATFDITKMAAPVVVQPALESLGITQVSADDVRQAMSFEGVVPQDAIDRISVIQSIAEKNPQALEEVLNVSYHPVQYKVSLDLKKTQLSEQQGIALLNAIGSQYHDWFLENYSNQEALENAVGVVDYTTYDYSEAADLLGVQITSAARYLESLEVKAPTFRASATNLTFADLASKLDAIKTVNMAKLNSLITTNNLAKDKASMEAYYSYLIRNTTNEMEAAQERLAGIQAAIAGYEKSTTIVYGQGTESTTVSGESEAYDDLVRQQVQASNTVANLRLRLKELQQKYDEMVNMAEQAVATPEATENVEGMLTSIPAALGEVIDQINATAQEYYETVAYKNAYQIQIPAQRDNGDGLMGIAKDCVMFIVLFEVLACVGIVGVLVVKTLASGEMFQKKRQA